MTEATERAHGGADEQAGTAGNVDKIREIIFGGQMRDYERRFSVLEERLLKENSDLRLELGRRLDALEAFVKKENELLLGRVKAEQQDRAEAVKELTQEVRTTVKAIEKKIGSLDEQTAAGHRELRQLLLAQSKTLSDEGRQRHQELTTALEKRAGQLQHDKTDRAALAEMLTELALRLKGDFKIPDTRK